MTRQSEEVSEKADLGTVVRLSYPFHRGEVTYQGHTAFWWGEPGFTAPLGRVPCTQDGRGLAWEGKGREWCRRAVWRKGEKLVLTQLCCGGGVQARVGIRIKLETEGKKGRKGGMREEDREGGRKRREGRRVREGKG